MNSIDNINSFLSIKKYGGASENALILGENYKVLKFLQKDYINKIQCIYADPPYNTCQCFDSFNDTLPRKKWLSTIFKRIRLLRSFLTESGSFWISIDDSEYANLKIICDEIFGVENYISTIIREKNKFPSSTERLIVHMHDYLLVYAKNAKKIKLNRLDSSIKYKDSLKSNDWTPLNLMVRCSSLSKDVEIKNYIYKIKTPFFGEIFPPKGRCWRVTKNEYNHLEKEDKIWFDKNDPFPYEKNFSKLKLPTTIWNSELVDSNQTAREEIAKYNKDNENFFYVPKPEKLLKTILEISTNERDFVLDPYLGSGTTAVVAHKMNRQWIGIEKEKFQCENICLPRLKDTIDEIENSYISNHLENKDNRGFSYYRI